MFLETCMMISRDKLSEMLPSLEHNVSALTSHKHPCAMFLETCMMISRDKLSEMLPSLEHNVSALTSHKHPKFIFLGENTCNTQSPKKYIFRVFLNG